jgi:hypothetical protein
MTESSTMSLELPVISIPFVPGLLALLTITTLRSVTVIPPPMLSAVEPPPETMLPTWPGMARIETLFVTVTVPGL